MNCKEREPGCHDHCEKYQTWLSEHIEESRTIRKEKGKYKALNEVTIGRCGRYKGKMV